ncbi:MFS transporter [Nonomuraea sp. NPDC049637]|uniref:MFS transporter n=1 Tax=Nonomuraea sp. NPDC049637 TaxID=3154356 RepID=UPI00341E70E5
MSDYTGSPSVELRSPRRWVVLLLCWASLTMTSVDRSTWGPASLQAGEALGVSLAGLGAFATAYYVGYVLSNIGGGLLGDRIGSRVVLSGSLFTAGGFMIVFGSVPSAGAGIAVQALIGLCAGADFAAGVKLIASWFGERERGLAMGVFTMASSLGTVIANVLVPRLIQWYDWRASYQLFGIVSMGLALVCLTLLRDRREPAAAPAARPPLRGLARDRDLLLIGLAGFGGLWGTYGFVTWSNTLMVKGHGLDPVAAGTVVVVFAAAGAVGKPVIGLATDLAGRGRKRPAVAVLVAFAGCLLLFGRMETETAFLVTAGFAGLGAYLYSPLLIAMVPGLSGTALAGSAAGATNAVAQLGSVTVPVVVGAVYQASGSFSAAFATLAAGPVAGAVALTFVREARGRPSTGRAPQVGSSA